MEIEETIPNTSLEKESVKESTTSIFIEKPIIELNSIFEEECDISCLICNKITGIHNNDCLKCNT